MIGMKSTVLLCENWQCDTHVGRKNLTQLWRDKFTPLTFKSSLL